MITRAIKKAFERASEKKWDRTYWAFDLHETIIMPNWSSNEIPKTFYPHARKAMQYLTQRPDIVSIMYTCSHPHEIEQYLDYFKEHEISFNYVNENPEVTNGHYGFYDKKPYFNVLFEDKAGFSPEDWPEVVALIQQLSL